MTQDDGGPAYPRPPAWLGADRQAQGYYWMQDGMSLRDYFAGQALPAVLEVAIDSGNYESPEELAKAVSETTGLIAEAMIADKREAAQKGERNGSE